MEKKFNLWREQINLNKVMLRNAPQRGKRAVENYRLALLSEISEHQDCYIWKHWCSEALAGNRWTCIDRQNAKVEAIDLLFFVMSLLYAKGITEVAFYNVWEYMWRRLKKPRKHPVLCALDIVSADARDSTPGLIGALVSLLKCYFGSEKEVIAIYQKKLAVNYARMKRGRKQVGDKYSETENRAIEQ